MLSTRITARKTYRTVVPTLQQYKHIRKSRAMVNTKISIMVRVKVRMMIWVSIRTWVKVIVA